MYSADVDRSVKKILSHTDMETFKIIICGNGLEKSDLDKLAVFKSQNIDLINTNVIGVGAGLRAGIISAGLKFLVQ